MGLLDFLFPAIMAGDSYTKLQKMKQEKEILAESKVAHIKADAQVKFVRENLYDFELEQNIEPLTDEELLRLSQNLPSYDQKKEWNVLTDDKYRFRIMPFKKRLALAKHGKLLSHDPLFSVLGGQIDNDYCRLCRGKGKYNYNAQIVHELYLLWEKTLQDNGFPFVLLAYNSDKHGISKRNAVPAKHYHDGWPCRYFWSYEFEDFSK